MSDLQNCDEHEPVSVLVCVFHIKVVNENVPFWRSEDMGRGAALIRNFGLEWVSSQLHALSSSVLSGSLMWSRRFEVENVLPLLGVQLELFGFPAYSIVNRPPHYAIPGPISHLERHINWWCLKTIGWGEEVTGEWSAVNDLRSFRIFYSLFEPT